MKYIWLLVGIAGLSMAGIFYGLASAPAVTLVSFRMLIATAVIIPAALWAGRGTGEGTGSRRSHHKTNMARSDMLLAVIAGALFAADLTTWAISLRFTTVASAALFVSTHPIFVAALAALLLRERTSALALAGIALGLVGICVVAWRDLAISGAALLGDGLALFAALLETGYLLIGRAVRARVQALSYVAIVYAACTFFMFVALVVSRSPAGLSLRDWLIVVGLALVTTVLGHTLVNVSLGHLPAAVVAVSFLAQPLLAAGAAALILHQAVPGPTAIGGIIALFGIGVVAYANERPVNPAQA